MRVAGSDKFGQLKLWLTWRATRHFLYDKSESPDAFLSQPSAVPFINFLCVLSFLELYVLKSTGLF